VIYGLGSLGTRIVGFFLIPVYTRFMTPADYGILALCVTTASVLNMLSLGGIPSALFRSYLHLADGDDERGKVQATALTTLLAAGALQFRNAIFRIHEQSARYSFFTLLTFVLNVGLSIALVVGLRQGAWGAMSANTAAPAFIALLFLPWCLRHLRAGFSLPILRQLLAYGLPLIPSGIAVWVMNLSDIYMLRIFRDADEVGLYNLGYRFGIGVLLISNAIKVAYPMPGGGRVRAGDHSHCRRAVS
jgi:O-antigen/teichoic acid export membrane protein